MPTDILALTSAAPFDGLKLLILSDGRAGHENQSRGVALALGVAAPQVACLPALRHGLTQWLPVPWAYGRGALDAMPDADLLIAAGWQMSRVSRWLRRRRAAAGRPLFTVQLMRPSGSPAGYDLVALPWHDAQRRRVRRWIGAHANVVLTSGMANLVTPAVLATARSRWHERLGTLPRPVLAVAIGGNSRHRALRPELTRQLMDGLLAWGERTGGSLLVTTSRRSGPQIADMIVARLKRQQQVPYRFWRPDRPEPGDNPYFGYLAHADAIVVTDDSLAMASEGMTAGLPVYLCGDEARQPPKFRAFFRRMAQAGRLARWQGELDLAPPPVPLADAARIAGFVRARWRAGDGGR